MLYISSDTLRESPTGVDEKFRSAFRRDYARLIHSAAFRRLQGKTQLFPGIESDFFRNRLTHSLEVAQIAKSIALRFNREEPYFRKFPIDTDLVEVAGLFHDLGHPPFGHNGEKALDDCMKRFGGFEGNAQTLRILARLEKKTTITGPSSPPIGSGGHDDRLGLNLTFRTLAASLKYDRKIPKVRRESSALVKGYYATEAALVGAIKRSVTGGKKHSGPFKTIECQIMDIADDIAYSTYDLEDSFKAGFLTPLDMLSRPELLNRISRKVSKNTGVRFSEADVVRTLLDIFIELFAPGAIKPSKIDFSSPYRVAELVTVVYRSSLDLVRNGYLRTQFTSNLVNQFIHGVKVDVNKALPALSTAQLERSVLEKVEVLKHFTFESLIMSSRLKVVEYRGYDIVRTIFEALASNSRGGGHLLLPDDLRFVYEQLKPNGAKKRVICDFIAGMTDRYAVEFFSRLKSENAQTIFKPL